VRSSLESSSTTSAYNRIIRECHTSQEDAPPAKNDVVVASPPLIERRPSGVFNARDRASLERCLRVPEACTTQSVHEHLTSPAPPSTTSTRRVEETIAEISSQITIVIITQNM
jgi:hypothetical protein